MSAYNEVATKFLAPAIDAVRGTSTMRHFASLRESQWWSWERIQQLQSTRLRELITHAYEHVPYYRQALDRCGLTPDDITGAEDIRKLPVLTKNQIRDNRQSLVAKNVPVRHLRPMATSGSTGQPLAFFSTREDQFTYGIARTFRAASWAGLGIADRYALVGRPRHYRRRTDQLLHELSLTVRRLTVVDSGTLSEQTLPRIAETLATGNYTGIGGSPPVLRLVADYILWHDLPRPSPDVVISGAEQLLDHERALLTEVFGTNPFSKYSSFEVYEIASECAAHTGMHIQAEDVVVEVVDEEGAAAAPGTVGRVLVTNLHNYAMPFIRYELGDLAAIDTSPCACGRYLPRLVGIVGRMSELIVTPSGRSVFGADLGLETFGPLGVRQFRVEQDETGKVVALLEWHSQVPDDSRAHGEVAIQTTLEAAIREGVHVEVRSVDHIDPHPSGKHLVVTSKLASRTHNAQ